LFLISWTGPLTLGAAACGYTRRFVLCRRTCKAIAKLRWREIYAAEVAGFRVGMPIMSRQQCPNLRTVPQVPRWDVHHLVVQFADRQLFRQRPPHSQQACLS